MTNTVTVGRSVHYHLTEAEAAESHGSAAGDPRPAVVTKVFQPDLDAEINPGLCNLRLVTDINDFFEDGKGSIAFDPERSPGTWCWMPRV